MAFHEGQSNDPQPEQDLPRKSRERYKWRDRKERAHRPMDMYLTDVLAQLSTSQVVIVQAETGVGKTTRIPQAILDSDPTAKIYLTQTKRPAVRMNARGIAKEMSGLPIDAPISDEELYAHPEAQKVGWTLRNEEPREFPGVTRATLLIDQSLSNRIRRERKLPDGYLIIDEAHERTIQIDIILALIKEYLPNSPKTKVLITSATIDTKKFQAFFDTPAPIEALNEQLYEIDVRPRELLRGEHHTQAAIGAAMESLTEWKDGKLLTPNIERGKDPVPVQDGCVIALLPGKEDIGEAMRTISAHASHLGISDKVEVIQCHSQLEKREQEQVERRVPAGKLRFVCATEIIRSSVTPADVVGVIDSRQVKRMYVDERGVSHLGKVTVSGAEADQAKGRGGRTQPSFYIPISFNGDYNRMKNRNSSEYWPQPAIQREALTSVILQIAEADLSIRTLPMLDKPESTRIDVAIKRLQKLGALNDKEEITEIGRMIVRFPIEPELAISFLSAEKLGVLPETILATAIIENEGIQYVPNASTKQVVVSEAVLKKIIEDHDLDRHFFTDKPMDYSFILGKNSDGSYVINTQDYEIRGIGGARVFVNAVWEEFDGGSNSDFVASINAYRAYRAKMRELQNVKGKDQILQNWCFDHFLNMKKLSFVDTTVRDLRDEISNSDLHLEQNVYESREFDSAQLTKALLSGLIDNLAMSSTRGYSGPLADVISVSNTSVAHSSPHSDFLLVGGVRKVELSGRGGTRYFADMVAPVDHNWILEMLPQLCEHTVQTHLAFLDAKTGEIHAPEEVKFNKLPLPEREVRLTGQVGTEKLAYALMEGYVEDPIVQSNWEKTERIRTLLNRSNQLPDFDTKFFDLMVKKLDGATSLTEMKEKDIALNEQDVMNLIGKSVAQLESEVVKLYPDTVSLAGDTYPVKYEYGNLPEKSRDRIERKPWQHGLEAIREQRRITSPSTTNRKVIATISLPDSLIPTFEFSMLPEIPGLDIVISVKLTSSMSMFGTREARRDDPESLTRLKQTIEDLRVQVLWQAFRERKQEEAEENSFIIPYPQGFPPLPSPEMYDAKSGALAYPAYRLLSSYSWDEKKDNWRIEWFSDKESAQQSQNRADRELEKIHERTYAREQGEDIKNRAIKALEQVQALFSQIDYKIAGLYNLELDEVSPYGSNSLKGRIESARAKVYSEVGAELYLEALKDLLQLRIRLLQALDYYEKTGKKRLEQTAAQQSPERKKVTNPFAGMDKPLLNLNRFSTDAMAQEERDDADDELDYSPFASFSRKLDEARKVVTKKAESPEASIQSEPAPEIVRKKYNVLIELLDDSTNNLEEIISSEKKNDVGKWRLAVAVLTTRGFEEFEFLLQQRIDAQAIDAILNALRKTVSEASTTDKEYQERLRRLTEVCTRNVEILRYLQDAAQNHLVREYFGSDQEELKKFRKEFLARLNRDFAVSLTFSDPDAFDNFIEAVIDKMTS